jgi:ubiquinone/menaquinone biosynthesis C-methylase UbiE
MLEWTQSEVRCEDCGHDYPLVDEIPVLVADVDPHKERQARFFDEADREFEITRPHGTPAVYQWLLDEKFRRSLSALEPLVAGATALNVCGGSGMDAEFLARRRAHVIVADISLGAVGRARERARRFGIDLAPVVADIERLPFADRSIDLVYVHDGLHHLRDPLAGAAEMARVARHAVSVNEPTRAIATRVAVRVGLSQLQEQAGNRIERVDRAAIADLLKARGFQLLANERYAMVYRHVPGRVARALSVPGIFASARVAISAFNRVAGEAGNKLTLQAVRLDSEDVELPREHPRMPMPSARR